MTSGSSGTGISQALFYAAAWSICAISVASAFAASKQSEAERTTIARKFDLLPLRFEPNHGQSSSNARFLAQGQGLSALFKADEADLLLFHRSGTSDLLRVTLPNASRRVSISAERRLPGTVNYFSGNQPERWVRGLPTFERLRYSGVYTGIDLTYYGSQGRLEFDFELAAGADPKAIRMRFEGAQNVKLDRNGNLIVTADRGQISFKSPVIYQPEKNRGKLLVAGSFEILGKNTIGFAVAGYDRLKPLVIDPILNYSTYVGPNAAATAVAVDAAGEAYVTGWASPGFPTTAGSLQTVAANSQTSNEAPFVAKFNSTGTALLYCTYLSGSRTDSAEGIALDANGDAFVVGSTSSTDFPITPGVLQSKNNASELTGFVAALNDSGTSLLYSTYLGGNTSTSVNKVVIDSSGNAYLTGSTQDTNFPTTQGAYRTTAPAKTTVDSNSAFVAKLNPTGTNLVYSTYLGGSQTDAALAIAVDGAGEAYVGGNTTSNDFPVTPGAIQITRESTNRQAGFVAKLNPTGSALDYSTYLSGNGADNLSAITVDSNGNAYTAGSTTSPDFPITPGALQPNIGYSSYGYPQWNAFVSELNSKGTSLLYSTFLGGNASLGVYADEGDSAAAIAVDEQGMVYLAGMACTGDFPITLGAFEPQNLDGELTAECTAFLTKLDPTPDTPLLYSTFFGGTGNGDAADYIFGEGANGLALDAAGNVYLAGFTLSVDFPITAGVFETPFNDPSEEAFVTEFNGGEMKSLPIPTVTLTSNTSSVLFGQPVTFTATVHSFSGNNTPTGFVGFNFFHQEPADSEGDGVGFGAWTTVPLNGSGVATFTTSSLEALQTAVIAHYLGDANNAPNTGTMTQTVTDISTATTLTSNANNVPYDTPVVFTAAVLDNAGKPAKGFVMFLQGNVSYATVNLDSSGEANWMNGSGGPPLAVGTDTITAQFIPNTGYQKSSASLKETFTPLGVTPAPTLVPSAGTYSATQQVVLADANSVAALYYTTDGSTPVPGTSPQFLSGMTIPVNASQTINAIALAPGYSLSGVVSATYTINLPPPNFAVSASPTSLTVSSAQQATVTLTVTPQNGFNSAVSFACSGLAAGASCAFSPGTVTPAGTAVTTTLTITAQTLTGALRRDSRSIFPTMTLGLAVCLLFWQRRRGLRQMLLLSVAVVGLGWILGCGGGNGGGGTGAASTPVTSTVTVTATSGSLQKTATVLLTVN